ncbi:alpha/beta fold hydrolase [Jannaschia sp. CCS1]|uniref:alpha/beta fold hydrolase n=1 Tax=Jannaschia sp. (strain CCS1) TaxID=290400 RepID=UPI000053B3E6|nr:alpha/beta fold hydrolase [Jannaschia sp. CCS1]ABD57071.1 alpha/beta hydrolase [Jannaschia sp. CCS1]
MTWTTRPRSEFGPLQAVRAGAGPCVVLLHGVGLRAEAWGAQINELSQDFDVIAPDIMAGEGLAEFTDPVAEALDRPAWIIGHSMGAMMALDLAIRYPGRVRGVVAMNAIFRRSDEAKRAVQARAAQLDGTTITDPSPTLTRWFGDTPSPERTACDRWLTTADPNAYRAAYTVFANEDGPSDTALKTVAYPALFLTGADEPNSTPAMSQAMAALTPQSRAVVIPDAAHMMPMTHPAAVNAHLRAFLTQGA